MVLLVKIPADLSLPLTEESAKTTTGDAIPSYLESKINGDGFVDTSVLIRHSTKSAGLHAYSISSTSLSKQDVPNYRATTLAMACGLHSKRFVNDVYIGRLGYASAGLANVDVSVSDLEAAVYTPDLRQTFIGELSKSGILGAGVSIGAAPDWLCSGAQTNYHDNKSMAALAAVMARHEVVEDDSESCSTSESERPSNADCNQSTSTTKLDILAMKHQVTLCIHCRRPASSLCTECKGTYFCDAPRKCKEAGWSHGCVCITWQMYVNHRDKLSDFTDFSGWQVPLLQEDCYSSDETYTRYLMDTLNVISSHTNNDTAAAQTWWSTEIHGWNGGKSASAKLVDLFQRVSYQDGIGLDVALIPNERHVTTDDIKRAGIFVDDNNMPNLTSWKDYYNVRCIPPSSPIALLATFPLTVYYAIQNHGIVPVTAAQMLDRPLKIHLVGIEKELNFIDFFKELGFLLPANVNIDMTWIIREDMFPEASTKTKEDDNFQYLSLQLTNNLTLTIIGGTYGDSLDPNFDIAGGAPDIIIGLNAGLYAYESWRHVVTYLDCHRNIVGVFTDYNEHSGMNCASLGGAKARQSLHVNPFRQPRAMPVNCMNLPQFSNGFMYVFNEQELE